MYCLVPCSGRCGLEPKKPDHIFPALGPFTERKALNEWLREMGFECQYYSDHELWQRLDDATPLTPRQKEWIAPAYHVFLVREPN